MASLKALVLPLCFLRMAAGRSADGLTIEMACEVGLLVIGIKLEKYEILLYFSESINFLHGWPRPTPWMGCPCVRLLVFIKSIPPATPPAGKNLRRHGEGVCLVMSQLTVCRRVPEHNLQEGLNVIPT